MIKTRLPLILSILLVIGALVILNFDGRNVKISPSYQTSSMKDLFLTHKEKGVIKWELSADTALMPIGKKEIYLNDLKLKINRQTDIFLTSGSGIYEVEEENIILNKPVELKMKDTTFQTTTIKWNSADEFITTDDAVQFVGNKFRIVGKGLTAQLDKEQVRIMNDVKAIFYR
jgi:LPS export ABC transporter protein LptC